MNRFVHRLSWAKIMRMKGSYIGKVPHLIHQPQLTRRMKGKRWSFSAFFLSFLPPSSTLSFHTFFLGNCSNPFLSSFLFFRKVLFVYFPSSLDLNFGHTFLTFHLSIFTTINNHCCCRSSLWVRRNHPEQADVQVERERGKNLWIFHGSEFIRVQYFSFSTVGSGIINFFSCIVKTLLKSWKLNNSLYPQLILICGMHGRKRA